MILEEATKEAYGYYVSELKPQSVKPILAACELCGEFRVTTKNSYYTFCLSCSQKGMHHSKESNAKISAAMQGNKRGLGHIVTEENKAITSAVHKDHPLTTKHKAKISIALKGRKLSEEHKVAIRKNHTQEKGKNNPNYKGGILLAWKRANAKRKKLGYILLMPLKEGEDSHHITDEYVIGIPADVHNSIGGRRKKHRTIVLQWLKIHDKKKYNKVLCVLAKQ